jgi:hypothetical protein
MNFQTNLPEKDQDGARFWFGSYPDWTPTCQAQIGPTECQAQIGPTECQAQIRPTECQAQIGPTEC